MMYPARLLRLVLPLGIACVLGCSEDMPQICIPDNLKTVTDSIALEYNSSGKLETIYYYFFELHRKDELDYDDTGRLVKIKRKEVSGSNETTVETGELIYDSKGLPEELQTWGMNTSLPPRLTRFLHDSDGRLLEREIILTRENILYRYEYDGGNNVTRIYYTNPGSAEVLGRENLSFDTHDKFYAGLRELEILNVYGFGAEPSRNNPLSSIIYWDGPSIKFPEPVPVTYDLLYNERGLIIHSIRVSDSGQQIKEFTFYGVNYSCR